MADEPDSFRVITRDKIFSWGITYRLRLDADVAREEQRLGRSPQGVPAMQRRSFARPAGWEIDVTLIGRELQPGDCVGIVEIVNAARLWSAWG